ncbi:MAG: hypothetical protein H7X86_05925 [Gorillibacterium sp.]|nr:hypothetical protein [Gorillibacterium sp.]
MTHQQLRERQAELLKRKMQELILKENQQGLNPQDGQYLRSVIKQFHQNAHELHDSK